MNRKVESSKFLEYYKKDQVIINPYNQAEIKHALDEAVRRVLTLDHKYVENHTHTDIKLLMGYIAVVAAGSSSLYSYLIPFEESKLVLLVGVIVFSVFNILSMAYIQYVEKEIIFVGVKKDALGLEQPANLQISSSLKPSSERKGQIDYDLTIEISKPNKSQDSKRATITKSMINNVGKYFHEDGLLEPDAILHDLVAVLKSGDNELHHD